MRSTHISYQHFSLRRAPWCFAFDRGRRCRRQQETRPDGGAASCNYGTPLAQWRTRGESSISRAALVATGGPSAAVYEIDLTASRNRIARPFPSGRSRFRFGSWTPCG